MHVRKALAAVSLGALPLLLPMEAQQFCVSFLLRNCITPKESKTVLRVADDGTHDEATEVMVKGWEIYCLTLHAGHSNPSAALKATNSPKTEIP